MILVLSAILIVVSGILWWQGRQPRDDPSDPEATEPVWAVSADEIQAVTLQRRGDTVRLEQLGGTWWVTAPARSLADRGQVQDLLSTLASMERGIPIEAPGGDLAPFGLGDPPTTRVVITTGAGEQTLEVGDRAPVGYRTYARGAGGGVVAVRGDANAALQVPASRFRDHRIFRFDPGAVRSVRIVGPSGELEVSGSGHDWWIEGFSRAEPDRVDDLVMGLLDMQFADILDETEGIESPTYDVHVTLEDGTVHRLRTGVETPLGTRVEAWGDPEVGRRIGLILPELLLQLGRGPTDVGIRTAFRIHLDRSDRVIATFGEARVEASRSGPTWSAPPLSEGAAYDLVQALADVGITYARVPPEPPGAPWGQLEVHEADRVRRVIVGEPVIEGYHHAVDADGGAPFRIPAEELAAALEQLP
ncbi:MAG TPA: DUF4340 domain-containing protein [Deltaproteobacteria bacterium]|nr:DUF4340 domain-containing protein [Deltaproteobacteria bacterium]